MSVDASLPEWTRPTLANWQDPPYNRWSFSHLRELVPTQRIHRGVGPVTPLPSSNQVVDSLPLTLLDGSPSTVGGVLANTYTDAVVAVHGGAAVVERYDGETRVDTPHLLMSVSKSLVGCVVGCLTGQGWVDPERLVTEYVGELELSGYQGARVRDLLDMRSGVAFSEAYNDPHAEVRLIEKAFGWRPIEEGDESHSMYSFLATLRKDREHGGTFLYRSCEADVLGWVCERASGRPMAELLSSLIWAPMGAQFDAEVSCDGTGAAIHDGGICATARDLARFGTMLLAGGSVGEIAVVPDAWLRSSWAADADLRDAFSRSDSGAVFPGGWYHNQFWFVPRPHGDVQLCLGIYGQMVYVNPFTGLVAAKLSSWPVPQSAALLENTLRAFDAIGAALVAETPSARVGLAGIVSGLSRNRGAAQTSDSQTSDG